MDVLPGADRAQHVEAGQVAAQRAAPAGVGAGLRDGHPRRLTIPAERRARRAPGPVGGRPYRPRHARQRSPDRPAAPARPRLPVQGTFDELGTPLREVTFVVVDLETTGGSAQSCEITEIGAVKVRGGEVLGEFQTLVNPAAAIPPFIAVLTGITDAMVAGAPDLGHGAAGVPRVQPRRGARRPQRALRPRLPAGRLRAARACAWPAPDSVDTARLARRVLTRDEAPNCKLATLARLFRADTEPCHRALADARATVDVLHGLLARVGGLGVQSLEELRTFSAQVTPQQRRKRHLADALPAPARASTCSATRAAGCSTSARASTCAAGCGSTSRPRRCAPGWPRWWRAPSGSTRWSARPPLEAEVRELRLIAEHRPKYNRRSRFPERAVWVKLTVEAFPRLSLVRKVADDGARLPRPVRLDPRRRARRWPRLHEALPLRQCTRRLSACAAEQRLRAVRDGPLRGALPRRGRRAARAGRPTPRTPRPSAPRCRRPAAGRARALAAAPAALAAAERFEDAAAQRDRLAAFVRAAARLQRLSAR